MSTKLIEGNKNNQGKHSFMHISCSTISPSSARKFAEIHAASGNELVTAPVFARPDGKKTVFIILYSDIHIHIYNSHIQLSQRI